VRALRIPADLVGSIRQHARATYPQECCGYLFAAAEIDRRPGARAITGIEPARNEYPGERERRFEIRPSELRDVERRIEGTDRLVAGFYPSHPDHPAKPSAFDEEHAWPWYTYLIVSVTAKGTRAIGAFELEVDSGRFRAVPLEILPTDVGTGVSRTPARA